MDNTPKHWDVFISRKSADSAMAKELYHFLTEDKKLAVFESDETLPQMGSSEYQNSIDQALDICKHLIVVGSSVNHINSPWVKHEWSTYLNEKLSGRKDGNILTVIPSTIDIQDLPISLRSKEVISFEKVNFEIIAAYVGKGFVDTKYKPVQKPIYRRKWFVPAVALLFVLPALFFYLGQLNKPFDASFILQPQKPSAAYPDFDGGELQIQLGNRLEKKQIPATGEIIIKQLPASLSAEKVPISLQSKWWKLEADTITLGSTINMKLIPNGALAKVFGYVVDDRGGKLPACTVFVEDTSCTTDSKGYFEMILPEYRQKKAYFLTLQKTGYRDTRNSPYIFNGGTDKIDLGPLKKL